MGAQLPETRVGFRFKTNATVGKMYSVFDVRENPSLLSTILPVYSLQSVRTFVVGQTHPASSCLFPAHRHSRFNGTHPQFVELLPLFYPILSYAVCHSNWKCSFLPHTGWMCRLNEVH